MFANLKAGVKLGMGFGIAVLILMAVVAFSYGTFQQANEQRAVFERNDVAKKILLVRGNRAYDEAIDHFKSYVLRGGEYDRKFASDIEAIREVSDNYRKLSDVSGNEMALLDEIDAAANAYLSAMNQPAGMRAEGRLFEETDKNTKGPDMLIYNALLQLEEAVARDAAGATHRFSALLERASLITAVLLAFALAMVLLLTAFIVLSIVRPVRRGQEATRGGKLLGTPVPGARRSGKSWIAPGTGTRQAFTRAMAPSLSCDNHFQRF